MIGQILGLENKYNEAVAMMESTEKAKEIALNLNDSTLIEVTKFARIEAGQRRIEVEEKIIKLAESFDIKTEIKLEWDFESPKSIANILEELKAKAEEIEKDIPESLKDTLKLMGF